MDLGALVPLRWDQESLCCFVYGYQSAAPEGAAVCCFKPGVSVLALEGLIVSPSFPCLQSEHSYLQEINVPSLKTKQA